MKRPIHLLLAVGGFAALGWWAYDAQREAPSLAFEVAAVSPVVDARAAPAAVTSARLVDDPVPGDSVPSAPAAGDPAAGAPASPPAATVAIGVEAARVETGALARTVSAVGTLRAAESVIVKPEVAGRIARIGFEGGQRVRRGDLLVGLDAEVVGAEVEQTRAELALARSNHQRTVELAERNFVSASARDQTAANLKILEARLKLAQARLSKTEIRAPFTGVLGLRDVSVGDYLKEGDELVALEDVSSMQVDLRLPERFLAQLRPGQAVKVELDAWPQRAFEARVEAVDVRVDADGRALTVRGRLPNPDAELRSGMFAKATLTLSENPTAMMVPEEAVTPIGTELFVYRISDGKAFRVPVRTGQRRDGQVEIVEGLQPGEQVIVAGQAKIQRNGQPVRLVDAGGREVVAAGAARGG